jgi:hypothetical protein
MKVTSSYYSKTSAFLSRQTCINLHNNNALLASRKTGREERHEKVFLSWGAYLVHIIIMHKLNLGFSSLIKQ